MARRIVDISIALDNETPADQPGFGPRIQYQAPAGNTAEILNFFPGLTVEQLPGGEGWGNETVTLRTHSGTHLDAPYHHHSTMSRGELAGGSLFAQALAGQVEKILPMVTSRPPCRSPAPLVSVNPLIR